MNKCIVNGCPMVAAEDRVFCPSHDLSLSHGDKVAHLRERNKKPVEKAASGEQVGGGHYKELAIQPAEFSERNRLTFLEGCVVKRVCRHRNKNGAEDIRKAIHELQLILEYEYGEE